MMMQYDEVDFPSDDDDSINKVFLAGDSSADTVGMFQTIAIQRLRAMYLIVYQRIRNEERVKSLRSDFQNSSWIRPVWDIPRSGETRGAAAIELKVRAISFKL
jgi:hypothetical protein